MLKRITEICDSDPLHVPVGTRFIFCLVCAVCEIFMSGFVLYHICIFKSSKDSKNQSSIPVLFRLLIFTYHGSVWILFILQLIGHIPILFNLGSSYDFSTNMGCNITHFWSVIPFGSIYSASVFFWWMRLIKIFDGTIYAVSQTKEKCITYIFFLVMVTGYLAVIAGLILSYAYTSNDNDGNVSITNNNSDAFCARKVNVIDFLPILQSSNKYSYHFKTNHFYGCILTPNSMSRFLLLSAYMIAMVTVPVFNGFLFYQFVLKLKGLITHSSKDKSIPFDSSQLYFVYLNCIIGMFSVATSSIALLLAIFFHHLFFLLMYVDVVINGYLMILVYKLDKNYYHNVVIRKLLHVSNKKENDLNHNKQVWTLVLKAKVKINYI